MSFAHAEKMHSELGDQGIIGGDCFATSLDSILQGTDLPDAFYYDIVDAQRTQDEDKFEGLIRQMVAKYFREDNRAFNTISQLSVYCAPDGNPLQWGAPTDPYEVVPEELMPWMSDLADKEWERVYGIQFEDEAERDRTQRAESAREDTYERLGMFVVARNMILDGVSLLPVHTQNMEGDTHVFAVSHNGMDDIHVTDTVLSIDADIDSYRPLERSQHLDLAWLCGLVEHVEERPGLLNTVGEPYTRITDSNIPVQDAGKWKYAFYPIPPQK